MMNLLDVIVLCCIVLAVLILSVRIIGGFLKKGAQARKEREAKEEEENKVKLEKSKEALAGKKIMVICRKKDGGKTSMETLLIDHFTALWARVIYVGNQMANDFLKDGTLPKVNGSEDALLLTCTYWEYMQYGRWYPKCDFRLMSPDNEIKAASSFGAEDADSLASHIVFFCGVVLATRG